MRAAQRALALGAVALAASGGAHALAHPTRSQSRPAAHLVEALAASKAGPADVPAGFERDLGYDPATRGSTLADPTGGCSTPGGLGPKDFIAACQTHDFGYDALRFAAIEGEPLGPWARRRLDDRLYRDLYSGCRSPSCRVTAALYYTAVAANSVRQGYGAPTAEPVTPWACLAAGIGGVALLFPPLGGRHNDREPRGSSRSGRWVLFGQDLVYAPSRLLEHLTGTEGLILGAARPHAARRHPVRRARRSDPETPPRHRPRLRPQRLG